MLYKVLTKFSDYFNCFESHQSAKHFNAYVIPGKSLFKPKENKKFQINEPEKKFQKTQIITVTVLIREKKSRFILYVINYYCLWLLLRSRRGALSFFPNQWPHTHFFNSLLLKSWCSKKYSILSKRDRKNELKNAFWINKDFKIFRRPNEVCNKSQRVAGLQNRRANAKKRSCHSLCCLRYNLLFHDGSLILWLFQFFWNQIYERSSLFNNALIVINCFQLQISSFKLFRNYSQKLFLSRFSN